MPKPFAKLTKDFQRKKPGSLTIWETYQTETKTLTRDAYEKIIDAVPFFRSLGGSERLQYEHTEYGHLCTKLTSTSPDRQERRIYQFDFSIQEA